MPVRGVIFDLFHTLTGRESEWSALPWTSDVLGIDRRVWDERLTAGSRSRLTGEQQDPYEILRSLAHAVDPAIPEQRIREALRIRIERFRHAVTRVPAENVETLRTIRAAGLRLGLISNADVMEVAAWADGPLAGLFDAEVFSCAAGCVKPEPAIYAKCLESLGLPAAECLFVGDGGSDELVGAKQAGLSTVFISGIVAELWPERVAPRLAIADHHIERIPELLALLGLEAGLLVRRSSLTMPASEAGKVRTTTVSATGQPQLERLQHADANVRLRAALDLVAAADERALEPLVGALCRERDVFVRETVTRALVGLGDAPVEPLIRLLSDPDPQVRHNAAHTLGKIGSARAADALVERLRDDSLMVVSKSALALGQIRDPRAIPALVSLLAHESKEVQSTLVSVLEGFGASAVPALIQALSREEWRAREQAAYLLGFIGSQEAVPALERTLRDAHWQVRFAAVHALGDLGGGAGKQALRSMPTDPDDRVRTLAARIAAKS